MRLKCYIYKMAQSCWRISSARMASIEVDITVIAEGVLLERNFVCCYILGVISATSGDSHVGYRYT